MKYLGNLIVSSLVFALAVVVFQIELVPIYDSAIVTLTLSALLASVIGMVVMWGIILVGLIPVGIGAISGNDTVTTCLGGLLILVILVVALFYMPYLMTTWTPETFDWFPQFSYWQYFGITIVSTLIGLATSNNSSKDK